MLPHNVSLVAAAMVAVVAASTCYNYNGNAVQGWYACNADAPVSPCCGSIDYCLSNGLCLDTGGDNYYTQQGCTDASWGSPCDWYCADNSDSVFGNYSRLWLCSQNNLYCCGADSSCCENSTFTASASFLSIGHYTAVSYPPEAVATSASTTATGTKATTTTVTVTATMASTTVTATSSNKNAVSIGVGVGVPVGLVCSAAALAAGFYWGRHVASAANTSGSENEAKAAPAYPTGIAYPAAQSQQQYPEQSTEYSFSPQYSPRPLHEMDS